MERSVIRGRQCRLSSRSLNCLAFPGLRGVYHRAGQAPAGPGGLHPGYGRRCDDAPAKARPSSLVPDSFPGSYRPRHTLECDTLGKRPMDPQQEAVLKKIAWRVVPFLTLAYVVNYLDRTNIGVASLTMNKDLGFTATQYGLGAGILFLGYTVFEIPSNHALYSIGARRWIARIMITWGVVSVATAWVYDANSYYIARFALGVAEAGFFPGVAYYFAAWFPTQYRTRMLAWFLVAIPVSSLIVAPISGWLMEMDGIWGLRGWQWLFIAEGIPAVLLGLVVLQVLADRPETATWLSAEEKSALLGMLSEERRERPKASFFSSLTDIRVIILAVVQF